MSRFRPVPNADMTKTPTNRVLVGSGDPYKDLRSRVESSGAKVNTIGHRRSVLGIDVILTVSPEYFRPEAPERAGTWQIEKLEEWQSRALAWAQSVFGSENVVSAIVHLDEATPHMTVMVAPIDNTPRKKGAQCRLNAARWLDGGAKLSQLQDSYAEALASLGVERGIRGSKAKHQSVSQFYGAMSQPRAGIKKPKVIPPEIPIPPAMVKPSTREAWASEQKKVLKQWAEGQENAVISQLTPQLTSLLSQSKAVTIFREKAKRTEETLRFQEAEISKLQKSTDILRDLPLDAVAEALSLIQDRVHQVWRGPGFKISVTGQKWFDHEQGQGGGGAIDLVEHCMECDFKPAVAFLASHFGIDRTSGAVVAKEAQQARERVKKAHEEIPKVFVQPEPSPRMRARLRRWLMEERGLDSSIIDPLLEQQKIYATEQHGHINAVFTIYGKAAELRGIEKGSHFKGLAPGSDRNSGPAFFLRVGTENKKALILCESAIDAMSFAQLHPASERYEYLVASTSGVRTDAPWIEQTVKAGWDLCCAYDADPAGDDAAHELMQRYPNAERWRPEGGKDWNEVLVNIQSNEKPEVSEKPEDEDDWLRMS